MAYDQDKINEDGQNELSGIFNQFAKEFFELRTKRHEAGAAEYGAFTFLGNDVVRMMMEELADTANYCEMQFIKLRFLQDALEEDQKGKVNKDGEITLGLKAFKGTKAGWNEG